MRRLRNPISIGLETANSQRQVGSYCLIHCRRLPKVLLSEGRARAGRQDLRLIQLHECA